LFDFLVDTFGLTVGLGVVGCRGSNFIPRSWLSPHMKFDTGPPITDHFFGEAVELPDVVVKEAGDS